MAISVQLGSCTEDPRKLDKSANFAASSPVSINAILKDNSSIMNPVFIVAPGTLNLSNFNYCYVSAWGRYYYITDMVTMPGARVAVKCDEDVLTSNAAEIGALSLYLDRTAQDSDADKYLGDRAVPAELRRKCITLGFDSTPFTANWATDRIYVLTVLGGVDCR